MLLTEALKTPMSCVEREAQTGLQLLPRDQDRATDSDRGASSWRFSTRWVRIPRISVAIYIRLSVSEIGRILRFEKIRPHRIRQWLKSSDPNFLAKAKRICNLYIRPPKNAVVVCVDEKPMQVLERKHPTHVDHRDGSVRYEYEYKRHGTQSLLAAFNVQTGRVFGQVVPHRTADALVSFMNVLARKYPKKKIYVVWDNLNTHYDGKDKRWTKFNKRHGKRFRFVYTPTHASWMNQVEVWFSILQRRVIAHGDFPNPKNQADRVLGFVRHWNRHERHPFRWTWRTEKLQTKRRAA